LKVEERGVGDFSIKVTKGSPLKCVGGSQLDGQYFNFDWVLTFDLTF